MEARVKLARRHDKDRLVFRAYVVSIGSAFWFSPIRGAVLTSEIPCRPPAPAKKSSVRVGSQEERQLRRELSNIEKQIARLDDQKKQLNRDLMNTADAKEALRLHEELSQVTEQLGQAEDRWCKLQDQLGEQ